MPGSSDGSVAADPGRLRLSGVAESLNLLAVNREVVELLREVGIRTLVLKGPAFQQRVFGTPAAYASGDVDLLVDRHNAAKAVDRLTAAGFATVPERGVLARIDRVTPLDRDSVRVDLHWGIHAGHLPAAFFSPLEHELWATAVEHPDGYWEPALEPLLVYLAVHAAGHRFERDVWSWAIRSVADAVEHWEQVWEVADRCRLRRAVTVALDVARSGARRPIVPLLDGWSGAMVWGSIWVLRGHVVPTAARQWAKGLVRGYRPGEIRVSFAGLELSVDRGVFAPAKISEALVERALERLRTDPEPVAVDVGSGSGAVALAVARALPSAEVHGVDISRAALRCARRNRRKLGLPVRFHQDDLLSTLTESFRGRVSVVISNAPYVDRNTWTATLGEWMPEHAVFGTGSDGLGLVRELARQSLEVLRPGGWLVLQVADSQWDGLAADLEAMGYRPEPPRQRRRGAVVGVAVAPGAGDG